MEIQFIIGAHTCELKQGSQVLIAMEIDELITLYYEGNSELMFQDFAEKTLRDKIKQ